MEAANRTSQLPDFPRRHSPIRPPMPPPPVPELPPSGLDGGISTNVLLIIVILAVVFFVSGLVHLLVRYLLRPSTRRRGTERRDNDVTALQGQLQQLFHLHDAGIDQSFIDSLPVFPYKAITGVKDPFDCAVCLCEFEADDGLRLLPKCSHAFHLECIDTWLLSHSTCPLCRTSLLPYFPAAAGSPIVLVLQSGGEASTTDIVVPESDAQLPSQVGEDVDRHPAGDLLHKSEADVGKEAETPTALGVPRPPGSPGRVVSVKLGKFRSVGGGRTGGEGSCSNGRGADANLDGRRCFSMGSFEYVMDESSLLQVAIKQRTGKPNTKKPGTRTAMSECGSNSGGDGLKMFGSARVSRAEQRDQSSSVSKIWLRPPKVGDDQEGPMIRRMFSLRLPLSGSSRRTVASELDEASWVDKSGSEMGVDLEAAAAGGGCAVSEAEEAGSYTRRSLLRLVGGRHPTKVMSHG